MSAYLTLEHEAGAYLRQLEVEADDEGNVILWEQEEIPGVSCHLARLAIPAHLAAAVASRIMSAAREAGR